MLIPVSLYKTNPNSGTLNMNMDVKQQIEADLKAAMLSGDKTLATTLRGLKSAILYAEVAAGSRETGLANDAVIALLQKEAKKRQESADLYAKGGRPDKEEAELAEKSAIEKYLPAQLSEDELVVLVDDAISQLGKDQKNMGQIIGAVKQKGGPAADGAVIARLVRERLQS